MTVQIYDARLDLEEAERKAQKMETDYEILMVENSHLTEEIDKFGEIVQRAERALAGGAASELGLGSSGGGGGGGGTSSLSSIKEHKSPKSTAPKSAGKASSSGTKRKQTPRSSASKKKKS
jgi:hypothetical protein